MQGVTSRPSRDVAHHDELIFRTLGPSAYMPTGLDARRRYRSGNPIMIAEPEVVPMSDRQQQEAITVLSLLFVALLVNEDSWLS
jgi:hypothetical protein